MCRDRREFSQTNILPTVRASEPKSEIQDTFYRLISAESLKNVIPQLPRRKSYLRTERSICVWLAFGVYLNLVNQLAFLKCSSLLVWFNLFFPKRNFALLNSIADLCLHALVRSLAPSKLMPDLLLVEGSKNALSLITGLLTGMFHPLQIELPLGSRLQLGSSAEEPRSRPLSRGVRVQNSEPKVQGPNSGARRPNPKSRDPIPTVAAGPDAQPANPSSCKSKS